LIAGISRAFELSSSGTLEGYLRFARSVRPIDGGPHGKVIRSVKRADSTIERPNSATVGSVGWNSIRIHAAAKGKIFNELAAMTVAHGSDIIDLCRELSLNENLSAELADLIDLDFLFGLAGRDSTTEEFDGSCINTPPPGWLKLRNDARVYTNAPSCVEERLSDLPRALQPRVRELEFQKQNDAYHEALKNDEERIPRHYGQTYLEGKESTGGSTGRCNTSVPIRNRGWSTMERQRKHWLNAQQKNDMWKMWRAGESLSASPASATT
jgi:hypothetical protein